MLLQPRPKIPFTLPKLAYGKPYLLRVEFATDDAAPIASPYAGEVGSLTITDSANALSVSSGELLASSASVATRDPWIRDATGLARVAGRALIIRARRDVFGAAGNTYLLGWHNTLSSPDSPQTYGFMFPSASPSAGFVSDGTTPALLDSVANTTYYRFAIVLRGTGFFLFIDTKLAWVGRGGSESTLYPGVMSRVINSRQPRLDYMRVKDAGGAFATDEGIATLNVASPAVQDYAATADQIIDLTLTAPGSITAEAGIIYRKLDTSNYWRAYFNTSGAFRVDSVSGGVATNQINVAGVIAAGQTRTIRIICEDSLHDAYTQSGSTWTKRGSQLNVSHQNTQAAVQPDIGAGWTAANLRSYPRTSSNYNVLDTI